MYRNIIWPQVFCVLGCDNLIKYNFFVPTVSTIWIKNIKVLKLDFETGQATRQSHIINATEVCNYMIKEQDEAPSSSMKLYLGTMMLKFSQWLASKRMF